MTTDILAIAMRCPICRQQTFARGNPFRPFCSERCKLIDLNNWFNGRYRISTPADRLEKVEDTKGSEEAAGEMASEHRGRGE